MFLLKGQPCPRVFQTGRKMKNSIANVFVQGVHGAYLPVVGTHETLRVRQARRGRQQQLLRDLNWDQGCIAESR